MIQYLGWPRLPGFDRKSWILGRFAAALVPGKFNVNKFQARKPILGPRHAHSWLAASGPTQGGPWPPSFNRFRNFLFAAIMLGVRSVSGSVLLRAVALYETLPCSPPTGPEPATNQNDT